MLSNFGQLDTMAPCMVAMVIRLMAVCASYELSMSLSSSCSTSCHVAVQLHVYMSTGQSRAHRKAYGEVIHTAI